VSASVEQYGPWAVVVNAGRIAHDRFPGRELESSYEASEIATAARDALIAARIDFCTETMFSHGSKVELVMTAVRAGYDVVLHVVMIPRELSHARVVTRVAAGGHDVPADKVEARYGRVWRHVAAALPHCHRGV
jgi:predicted ABC-type ATPase